MAGSDVAHTNSLAASMPSHGQQADSLSAVATATELSRLLSNTAMFFRSAHANRSVGERFDRLAQRAQELVARLQDIADGVGKPDAQLPYRQLIPVSVWRTSTADATHLSALVNSIPTAVEQVLKNGSADNLVGQATELEEAANRLRQHATLLLLAQR